MNEIFSMLVLSFDLVFHINLPFSIITERTEACQYCSLTWHHSIKRALSFGIWVSSKYQYVFLPYYTLNLSLVHCQANLPCYWFFQKSYWSRYFYAQFFSVSIDIGRCYFPGYFMVNVSSGRKLWSLLHCPLEIPLFDISYQI